MKRVPLNDDDRAVFAMVRDALARVQRDGKASPSAVDQLKRQMQHVDTLVSAWESPTHPRFVPSLNAQRAST